MITDDQKTAVRLVRIEEVPWIEAPGHHGALSKLLVNPDNCGTKYYDFRISSYEPKGHVEVHTHTEAEHVYYILSGKGLMTLGDETVVVEPHTAIFIAPGVKHAIDNTGIENLVFIVVAVPPNELSREDTRAAKSA
ncbi:MAG: Cupin 2 conserved barrel domain protein [Candidatus Eremiobacteraeota bacterium]|jgi:mannose-6-phosphate isomerase-like protein (cupin superfamily)|nr:Cupin 2 conserved barrel domain protein [Candidatus Eremiobacteraeota bacterium]